MITFNSTIAKYLYVQRQTTLNSLSIDFDHEGFDSIDFAYSYAFDDVTYSQNFATVEQMLSAYQLESTLHQYVYVRILVNCKKNDLSQSYAYCDITNIIVNGDIVTVTSIEQLQQSDKILQNFTDKNIYQAYRGLESAHELNKKLSYSVSQIYGHRCTYFRTEPRLDDQSITFKSYKLSKVVEYKEIKIVLNNNDLPDNRNSYSEWEQDFIDQIEAHIVIDVFAEIFGSGAVPNADDYLFLPLTDRMYQVNTVNAANKFMNKATYYQMVLVKWNDRADVDDVDVIDGLPDITRSEDYEFEKQVTEYANATKSYNYETDKHNVESDQIVSNGQIVLNYMFDFNDKIDIVDMYQFASNTEYAIGMWFKCQNTRQHTLFDVIDTNDKPILSVHTDRNSILSVDYSNSTNIRQLTCTGSALQPNIKHCILLNYCYNNKGKYLTVTVLNDQFVAVQENYIQNIDQFDMSKSLRVYGQQSVGNIRISKHFIKKYDIQRIMSDMLPNVDNYYALMNATPALDSQQSKVN